MEKLRLLLASLAVLLVMGWFSPNVHAGDGQTYQVGTDMLKVRSGPSSSAATIGQLDDGDLVTIFDERYGWAQTYYDGREAWVAKHLLIPDEASKPFHRTDDAAKTTVTTLKPAREAQDTLNGSTIVLDAGHGGRDTGAIAGTNVLEKDLTMNTVNLVAEKLRQAGASVALTRSNDAFIPLSDRVRISNASEADAFISLHYNSFPLDEVNGFSTYYYDEGDEQSLARDVQSSLKQNIKLSSRGVVQNNYHVLRENRDVSILIELGFLTNDSDRSIIQTEVYQTNVANGIVDGLDNHFNQQ
ncbi:hypothetical protein GCM10008983_13320 [Lentibacillus halophilus]|uniref:SH3b domain-containing protein n=1 Tax=Lentibacillus halophilus TaxID=295065 RepID=A0ABP3J251_9BACI